MTPVDFCTTPYHSYYSVPLCTLRFLVSFLSPSPAEGFEGEHHAADEAMAPACHACELEWV